MSDFINISSKDNPLIKLICSLQSSSKTRKEEGLFVLEGLRICKDALENGIKFDKLIVSKSAYEKYYEEILLFAQKSENRYVLTDNLFQKISDTDTPQGIICVAKTPFFEAKIDSNGRYIALENLQDPSNLGAISRTAEALGVSGIILASGCDPYSPKSLRASMGTLLRMPIYITKDLSAFIKNSQLKSYGCVVDKSAEKISNINFENGSAVIIGNEANGLTDEAKSNCYKLITIPMKGNAESLNAAVAASIAMWEMMK